MALLLWWKFECPPLKFQCAPRSDETFVFMVVLLLRRKSEGVRGVVGWRGMLSDFFIFPHTLFCPLHICQEFSSPVAVRSEIPDLFVNIYECFCVSAKKYVNASYKTKISHIKLIKNSTLYYLDFHREDFTVVFSQRSIKSNLYCIANETFSLFAMSRKFGNEMNCLHCCMLYDSEFNPFITKCINIELYVFDLLMLTFHHRVPFMVFVYISIVNFRIVKNIAQTLAISCDSIYLRTYWLFLIQEYNLRRR